MSTNILMPALSPTMEEGKITKWLVKEGDKVQAGDILAEIETDKATMEFEAVDEGIIGKILTPAGDAAIAVNTVIAQILEDGESASDLIAEPQASSASALPAKSNPAPVTLLKAEHKIAEELPFPDGTEFTSTTVRVALRDAMAEEMRRDETVFLMGEEVGQYQGAYKISQGLLEEFGEKRVIDTPITEMGFTGLATGAAYAGLRPIVEFMTFNFAMQSIDHIINSAAKTLYMSGGQMNVPIVFRGANGAAARVAAQHSQDYAAWYAQIPGLKVVQPYSADDAKGLLKSAIRDPNPVVFLENEILYGQSFDVPNIEDYTVPIGKARIRKTGSDLTLISFGIGMHHSLKAAEALESLGISVEVIDLRSLRPIDYDCLLNSVRKTHACITVEEGFPVASIGNHIGATIMQRAFDELDAPVLNVTGKDVPMPYAENLERHALVTVEEIIAAARQVTYK